MRTYCFADYIHYRDLLKNLTGFQSVLGQGKDSRDIPAR